MSNKMLRPDSKGRITLGSLANGVSGFTVTTTKDKKIVLVPYFEIPFKEKWLFDNKKAMKKVKQGLEDAAQGKLIDRGSFSEFIDDSDDNV